MTDNLPATAGTDTPNPETPPTEATHAATVPGADTPGSPETPAQPSVTEETPAGAAPESMLSAAATHDVPAPEQAPSRPNETAAAETQTPPAPPVETQPHEAAAQEKPAEKRKAKRAGKDKHDEPAAESGEPGASAPGAAAAAPIAPGAEAQPAAPPSNKRWYAVKVQSGREDTIKDAIERRVKIEGLEEYFGQILIPVEYVPEMRKGKRINRRHKLYPGYLMVEVEFNDRMLYLFRETTGVGDFVGGGVNKIPPPLSEKEVERITHQSRKPEERKAGEAPAKVHVKPRFSVGDRLKVNDGTFAGMEGEVMEILEDRAAVRLQLSILGRPVPCELEYWQVEPV
jgi:transcriptional antiterminator NusG